MMLRKKFIYFAFIISLIASFGSLGASFVFHLEPCELCWYQRICMLTIFLLFIYYYFTQSWRDLLLILTMASIGLIISLYHVLIQDSLICLIILGLNNPQALLSVDTESIPSLPLLSFGSFFLIFLFVYLSNIRKEIR